MSTFTVDYRDRKRRAEKIEDHEVDLNTLGWAIFTHASGGRIMVPYDLIDSIEQHAD